MNPNHQEIKQALDRAEDTLNDSQFVLSAGRTLVTVNRAYYSMYYCMCALLYAKNVYAKTHTGTITKFDELYIKSGIFARDSSAWVRDAFNLRQEADYDLEAQIDEADAQKLVENARKLFELAKEYLQEFQ